MLPGTTDLFPDADGPIFLGHCSVSPLYRTAARAIRDFTDDIAARGVGGLKNHFDILPRLHDNGARLLGCAAADISFVHNTAEALSMVANGYPFAPGDQIISYVHEYPSNHYPWVLQGRRGVELILLADRDPLGRSDPGNRPRGWSMDELEERVTARTRVVAISHVQFSSGYAADLRLLGGFCRERGIDLVVDCAQSLGCLPLRAEACHIAALAASGWKWLLGPWASGLLYTRSDFRRKLQPVMTGPGMMRQHLDYLDHRWDPHDDGRLFEYSTVAWDHAAGLNAVLEEVFLRFDGAAIRDEVFRLQDVFLAHCDPDLVRPLRFDRANRSGIVALEVGGDVGKIMPRLAAAGVVMTGPAGYLRLAPHFYQQDRQMIGAAAIVNRICAEQR
ncbi:MAG: aminotransferase class V-fold PLP-dependent enzyme [Desulfoprunum sp.]